MVIQHYNNHGYIQSYFEWDVVDSHGKQNNLGRFMHVRHIWVHPDHDGVEEIKQFIRELDDHKANILVKWIYWVRDKQGRPDRPSKLFSRENCLRKAGRYAKALNAVFN